MDIRARRAGPHEALARRADQNGEAEAAQLSQAVDQLQVLARVLGEAEAGIEDDGFGPCARPQRDLDRPRQEGALIFDHVGELFALAPRVHQAKARPVLGGDARDVGLALRAPDVVDGMCTRFQGEPRGLRPVGVDGEDPSLAGEPPDDRQHAPLLLLGLDRHRIRACRFASHIDDVSALVDHAIRMVRRDVDRGVESSAIGEAVRRHVEDAHDDGAGAEFDRLAVRQGPTGREVGVCGQIVVSRGGVGAVAPLARSARGLATASTDSGSLPIDAIARRL
mgnify:CR=1 FL=1